MRPLRAKRSPMAGTSLKCSMTMNNMLRLICKMTVDRTCLRLTGGARWRLWVRSTRTAEVQMGARQPTFGDILAARRRLGALACRTPLIEHPALNAVVGGRVLLKAENLQRIGAFKFRGAYNKVAQVDKAAFPGGVVACSSGNHAQGVAAAATLMGLASAIVMPADAPRLKIP